MYRNVTVHCIRIEPSMYRNGASIVRVNSSFCEDFLVLVGLYQDLVGGKLYQILLPHVPQIFSFDLIFFNLFTNYAFTFIIELTY